jgi:tRNA A-37 threonylcarbamoyl transferase component Bud32
VWTLVKQNVSRTVFRLDAPGGECYYFKRFHSPTRLHRLERLLGRSDAMTEMAFSQYLSQCGLPVPRVLAACCRSGEEWMISQGLSPADSLDHWHAEQLAAGNHAAIRRAVGALAQIVGRMHACGVIHRDLHCGNILIRNNDPADLVLMDLHRMQRRRKLSRRSRAANIAQIFCDRFLWTTRTERLLFLREYLRVSGAEGSLRGWVRLIEPLAERHSRRLNAQRERRIFANNRYFSSLEVGGCQAHVVLASRRRVPGSSAVDLVFTPDDWRAALADPAGLLHAPDAEVTKDSASSRVVRRQLRVGPHTVDVYIKRSHRKRAVRWLTDLFRPSRSLRAFRMGHALLARHIPTALPLAALERRVGPFLVDSILITETVGNSLPLSKFLNRYLPAASDGEGASAANGPLARYVLWQLGRLIRQMHQAGFAHRDLKGGNLLVHWDETRAAAGRPDGGGQMPEIVMVDLDGMRTVRHVSRRLEFRGLMRLNVSVLECPGVNHAGRLRMLMGYLRRPGSGHINFKPYWRLLQQWSGRKIRKQIASRRRRQKVKRKGGP